jgi:hypothetical protein
VWHVNGSGEAILVIVLLLLLLLLLLLRYIRNGQVVSVVVVNFLV